MPRSRKIGTVKRRNPVGRVEKVPKEARLEFDPIESADLLEEPNGGPVAPHEDVLAVIDHRTSRGIGERARPASQVRFLLEQMDPVTGSGQRHASRQSGKAAADNHNRVAHEGSWTA